ncbi:MAG: hypothetical protein FWD37_01135, partial [Methanomassiliicoccaceae archaeon]|nr:hypothetical protein [Methanomassiliicoccaceae archaeon]
MGNMLLTYNVKHGIDISSELEKGRMIAETAIHSPKLLTTKAVSHIGLKATISNQILRKYGRRKETKKVSNIVLPVPGQGVVNRGDELYISCLKCTLPFYHKVEKINYIEFDKECAHITCTVPDLPQYVPERTLGVDRNSTSHIAVVSCPETGKIQKYGKQCLHIHEKYS